MRYLLAAIALALALASPAHGRPADAAEHNRGVGADRAPLQVIAA